MFNAETESKFQFWGDPKVNHSNHVYHHHFPDQPNLTKIWTVLPPSRIPSTASSTEAGWRPPTETTRSPSLERRSMKYIWLRVIMKTFDICNIWNLIWSLTIVKSPQPTLLRLATSYHSWDIDSTLSTPNNEKQCTHTTGTGKLYRIVLFVSCELLPESIRPPEHQREAKSTTPSFHLWVGKIVQIMLVIIILLIVMFVFSTFYLQLQEPALGDESRHGKLVGGRKLSSSNAKAGAVVEWEIKPESEGGVRGKSKSDALVPNTSRSINSRISETVMSEQCQFWGQGRIRERSVITGWGREVGTYWVLWLPTQARVSMSGKIRADLATVKDDIRSGGRYTETRSWRGLSGPQLLVVCMYTMVYQNCI